MTTKQFKIRSDAKDVLLRNYESCSNDLSFVEYVKDCASNDPYFFMWLFDIVGDESYSDFECPDDSLYSDFLSSLV